MEENANKALSTIKLDVGGKTFKTTKETLLSKKDTFFYAMISSGRWLPDQDGSYFIDRNPKLFPYILDYLRYGKVDLSLLNEKQLKLLEVESDFYLVKEIFDICKEINGVYNDTFDICKEINGVYNDTFDTSIKGPSTNLSESNKRATASKSGHTCAIGVNGISSGKQTWKLRMNHFASKSHWIMVGVIFKPISNLSNTYSDPSSYGLSSTNQKYTADKHSHSNASNDWMVGHIVQIDLDCNLHTLTIRNLNTGKSESWQNLPVKTYYLHVNLYNANDSVTILDE